jgi:hypothetical protein
LSWWTYGGNGADRANAIKVVGPLVHVAGRTQSANFPTTSNAVQVVHGGGRDFFYMILHATSGALLYATLLGGSGDDVVTDLELDPNGGAWLFGGTTSPNFPVTANAYQGVLRGASDLALAHVDPALGSTGLRYATFFGGSGAEPFGNCSDLDRSQAGVLSFYGDTDSTDLPVTGNAWRAMFQGGTCDGAFVRLDPRRAGAAQLVYGTYVGGNGFDNGNAMWVDGDVVTLAGFTASTNLPLRNAPQAQLAGMNDAYVQQIDVATGQLWFGTYLGGARNDGVNDLAVDACGHITITGQTGTPFPTTLGAWQTTLPQGGHGYVAKLDPLRGRVLYASHVGAPTGTGSTAGTALCGDGLGGVAVFGNTSAASLPVTVGPPLQGTADVWVAKLSLLPQGVSRHGDSSWQGGSARSFVGVSRMPRAGDAAFSLFASGAPGMRQGGCGTPLGVLLVGPGATSPIPRLGIHLHVSGPSFLVPVPAGRLELPLSLAGIGAGAQAAFQFVYAYPTCVQLHASNGLQVVVQP